MDLYYDMIDLSNDMIDLSNDVIDLSNAMMDLYPDMTHVCQRESPAARVVPVANPRPPNHTG